MKRGYVDTLEGQIHYRIEGKGEPLVFLHRVGLSSDEFIEVMEILGKYYLAVAPDFLGYGNSDYPPNPIPVEEYTKNIVHFLDAMKIKKASVVGSRLGSSIGVELAATNPARVNKLILIGTIYPVPEEQEQRLASFRKKRQDRIQINEDGSHLLDHWKERVAAHYGTLELAQRNFVEYLKADLGRRAEDGHLALYSYNLGARFPLIKSPTLLIHYSGDSWLKRSDAIQSLIPNCQKKVIEGSGPVPTWEQPREYAQAIKEFTEKP